MWSTCVRSRSSIPSCILSKELQLLSVLKSPAPQSPQFRASLGDFIIHSRSCSITPELEKHWHKNQSEMIPESITHFRCRFSVVLILVSLLTSPTQVSSEAKSCAAVTLALNGFQAKLTLGKDSQFVHNLADCLNEVKKPDSETRGIIQQLPGVIDKVLPEAWTEGLVLLSMYFLYKSFLLYDEAKILEVNVKTFRGKFEALEKEMKPFRDFIDTELIPLWEEGNTATLEKKAEEFAGKDWSPLCNTPRVDSRHKPGYQKGRKQSEVVPLFCCWRIVRLFGLGHSSSSS